MPDFDSTQPWRLNSRVALRPEPFGAMAYHFDNRRLQFLRHVDLVTLVETMGEHPSVDDALTASGIDAQRWPSFRSALAKLAASDFLEPV